MCDAAANLSVFPAARGVYVAQWTGPKGEFVLLAIDSKGHLVGLPYEVPLGGDHVGAGDEMWDRLDRADPDRRTLIHRVK